MIGVISDTHGLVRPQVFDVFQGVKLIIHAGDIGSPDVLTKLKTIAPVIAVRGNNDRSEWADCLPATQVVEQATHFFYVLHEVEHLDLDPAAADFSAVIFGHSHRPVVEYKNRVLFLNPGSAGPRRFSLPIAVARLKVTPAGLHPEIIFLAG
ncbi:MAG: metallophosphoesterase family protein [Nitrospirales bacterium]